MKVNLRSWQHEFLRECDRDDFLLVACPGAGKTIAALRAINSWRHPNSSDRVIVVVPTDHLKRQWKTKAAEIIGLELWTSLENRDGVLPRDCPGIVVTYHQVARAPAVFRQLAAERRTMVVLDEVHHCGDDEGLSWGRAVKEAFEVAARRLCMSGTPFRSDSAPIPFIRYNENNESVASAPYGFSYGYSRALKDGVCREIYFPNFEGRMRWASGGREYLASFAENIPTVEINRRLATALQSDSEWMLGVIKKANTSLQQMRADDARAGGIVIANDTAHAESIANAMYLACGARPTVVTSEYDDASDRIAAFDASDAPWIVAVKMISEGVDIPRLRVLVYATTKKTELFFRQAVGRVSRGKGMANCFIPADPDLVSLAAKIQEERVHALEELQHKLERVTSSDRSASGQSFVPLGADALQFNGAHLNGEEFTREEMERAEEVAARMPHITAIDIAKIMRLSRAGSASNENASADVEHAGHISVSYPVRSSARDRDTLRADVKEKTGTWAALNAKRMGIKPDSNFFAAHRKRVAKEPLGRYVPVKEATIDELETTIAWLERRIVEASR